MNKNVKKIIFTSLCFMLCGILYFANGFATKENVEVKAAKKAIDASVVRTTYKFDPAGLTATDTTCIRSNSDFVTWYQNKANAQTEAEKKAATPPFVVYVKDGSVVTSPSDPSQILYCNGTFEKFCTENYGLDGFYYDAGFTEVATKDPDNTSFDDVVKLKLEDKDANGCYHTVTSVTILYVKCNVCEDPDEYTIVYHKPNGTTTTNVADLNYSVYLIAGPAKDGYTFEGWYFEDPETVSNPAAFTQNAAAIKNRLTIKEGADYISAEDGSTVCHKYELHLYPKYTKNQTCRVVNGVVEYYDGNNLIKTIDLYAKAENEETIADIRNQISLAAPAAKPGFRFAGWYSDADFKNEITKVTDLAPAAGYTAVDEDNCDLSKNNNYKLYAKYECLDDYEKKYTIHYFDGKEEIDSETLDYGTYPTLLSISKTNFIFVGWFDENNKEITDPTKIEVKQTINEDTKCPNGYADVNLYAKWEVDPDITCKVYNGIVEYYDGDKVVKTIDLKSKADSLEKKIYYYNDDKVVETRDIDNPIKLEEKVDFEPVEKKGYNFIGWYADSDLTIKITNFEELEDATSLYVGAYIDEDKCLVSTDNYKLYAKYEKLPDNPDTGDMLFVYIALGLVLVAGSGIVVKKIMSNK